MTTTNHYANSYNRRLVWAKGSSGYSLRQSLNVEGRIAIRLSADEPFVPEDSSEVAA